MKSQKLISAGIVVMMTALLPLAGGSVFAANETSIKPELAAKKEMVRKQREQRISPAKRKAAVEALKAERMKVYQAKKAVQQSNPDIINNK
ncbi:MAG: hypothetical protein PHR66_10555 [Desulfuromonadaceae bacterium]|nr:hypothetical protein [Desulfuromonadaceae bacterium]